MKRPRSYGEDLDEEWSRRDSDLDRHLSHRRFYPKSDHGRKLNYDEDRDVSRLSRKRSEQDSEVFDRRRGYDRYRECSDWSVSGSPRNVYVGDRIRRSESLSGVRREFDKRMERDRLRREECVSAWRRSVIGKESDEDVKVFGGNSERGSRDGSEDKVGTRSSPGSREVCRSPPWSKDSGSERSKSVELKKKEEEGEACGDSAHGGVGGGGSSEMEEGELEPDPDPDPDPSLDRELENEANSAPVDVVEPLKCSSERDKDSGKDTKTMDEENLEDGGDKEICHEKGETETEMGKCVADSVDDKIANCHEEDVLDKVDEREKELETNEVEDREEDDEEEPPSSSSSDEETVSDRGREEELNGEEIAIDRKLMTPETGNVDSKHNDLEAEADGPLQTDREVMEESNVPNVTLRFIADKLSESCKDKGKSIVVSHYSDGNSSDCGGWIERDLLAAQENDSAGPSNRGFELFLYSDKKMSGKANQSAADLNEDVKLTLEPLELSLGLPNVKLASKPKSSSPSRVMSVQSLPTTFFTGSDGFTASMSFSASEHFVHNPSCSLTQNSLENYEHSVGSHPIFQGVDQVPQGNSWQGQSSVEPKRKEVPLFQRILQNGNGPLQSSNASRGHVNGHTSGEHRYSKLSEAGNGTHSSLDRQLSLPRQLPGRLMHDEARSPSHSVGSRENRSEQNMDKKVLIEQNGGGFFSRAVQREMELPVNGVIGATMVVAQIVSEPIHIMARSIQNMTEHFKACLKERVCELIDKEEKQGDLRAFQEILEKRADLTLETLLDCNRIQLEILVALKTGLRDFLWHADNVPSSDLVEIFLNLKCRNIACRSILPVDECDCKVCVKKKGFCSTCMCLVCSKFDMASNTCSWVGCDVCLHWCHTDCGLRNSYIRNGQSASGNQGTTEMQFHCVACDHPSEMFGFVKEVFKTCAKDWNAATLSKELEYVRRIFSTSNDIRGKQMHDVAGQMWEKLESGSNLLEVYNCIMAFFADGNSKMGTVPSSSSAKDVTCKMGEDSNDMVSVSQDTNWLRSVAGEKAPLNENTGALLSNFDWERVGGQTAATGLQLNTDKKPVVDELESIVRIKQAEAKMFQARADDARRDAESLKRIADAKNDKIEEEYTNRIAKLRLVEAKEKREQKLEELQAIEKSYRDYFSMKMRMEEDIKGLLLKVEETKRNLRM